VYLVGSFPVLEDQLTQSYPGPRPQPIGITGQSGRHDLRLTELLVEREPWRTLLDWYAQQAAAVRAESARSTSAAGQRNGAEVSTLPLVPLTERPHAVFQAASGRNYTASETGEIECANPDDPPRPDASGCEEQH
jgi:hypothetical protein